VSPASRGRHESMNVDVMPMGTHEYAVNVTEGHLTTAHRVVVPEDLLDALGPEVEEERVVNEAVHVFLDHQNATALPQDLTLDWIAEQVPEFGDELRARLT
jgi:hypothetical protein